MALPEARPGTTLGLAGRWAFFLFLVAAVVGGVILWFRYGTAVAPLVGGPT